MNRCKKCNYPYQYEDMFKASWQLIAPVKAPCPKCGHIHYLSQKQIVKIYAYIFVVNLLIMCIVNLFHLHSYVLLTIYMLSLIALLICLPLLNKITEYPDSSFRRQKIRNGS
ncbi:TIGR04104 family putative zinc finger protein [Macrococcoides canis]|uniref:TIGR04104 family putative zinc finger protein n=1 Tax=Macrococcoides canis TaxID=1855823 RepID=UPI0013E958A7|nr:TIGR04104 family putative zinc finger protein [Macrococcus canis]QIH76684.1 hypothetical protein GTN31_10125 [Macrococcus canis]QTQ07772.1 hypothetical protein J9174_10290 [Macrococcus canis]QUR94969.1 hypothetical protein GOY09_08390 [Macrococcus canis]UTH02077.1 hypothetical protein KFV05_10375 [Macrococcus canis]UTH06516.1 hypothetical protein KFV07_10265 [Macrococcus canis]